MKKAVIILLIFVYSLSTLGVGLKKFYCCGKLKSVTFTLRNDAKDKSAKTDGKDGCCKIKHQFFKVKDNQNVTSVLAIPLKHCTDVTSFHSTSQDIGYSVQQENVGNGRHAPPLPTGLPIYLFNCVFRI